MSKANTTKEQHPRERVDWRLPGKLEADMANGGGLPKRQRSEKWQSNLRTLLDGWAERSGRVEYDPAAETTRMCPMYVRSETVRKLEAEARRLSELTGKMWSAAAVVRLVWEQERGR